MVKEQTHKPLGDDLTAQELLLRSQKALEEGLLAHAENLLNIVASRSTISEINQQQLATLNKQIITTKSINKEINILVFGDSLSLPAPNRLKDYHPVTNPFLSTTLKETYPRLLHKQLLQTYPRYDCSVTNLSKRGYTVRDIVDMRDDIFCWHNPDVIIFHVGLVDAFPRGEKLDEQKTGLNDFKRFFKLIMDFRDKSCPSKHCIFINISPTDNNIANKYPIYQTHILNFNKVFDKLVENYSSTSCLYMDTLFDQKTPYNLLHRDGQHLSTSGHKQVAGALTKLIAAQLTISD